MKQMILILSAVFLFGCASVDVKSYATPDNARIATTLVCANALQFVKTDAERIKTANYIYAVAHAIRTLSGGKVPDPSEVKAAINLFTPDNGKYSTLAVNVASIWGALYPQILGNHAGSNTAVALAYLEALASGCETAAQPYIATP